MTDTDWMLVWDIVMQHPSLIWTTIIPALSLSYLFGWLLKALFTGRALAGARAEVAEVRNDLAGVRVDLAGVRGELAGVREQNATLKERVALHEGHRQWAEAQVKPLRDQVNTLTEQLAAAQASNDTLQKQIAADASKDQLVKSAAASSVSLYAASGTAARIASSLPVYSSVSRPMEFEIYMPSAEQKKE